MKSIAFLIVSNGVDGRDKTHIWGAWLHESERDKAFDALRDKNFHSKEDRIIDADLLKVEVLKKLDGLEKLVLGLNPPAKPAVVYREANT